MLPVVGALWFWFRTSRGKGTAEERLPVGVATSRRSGPGLRKKQTSVAEAEEEVARPPDEFERYLSDREEQFRKLGFDDFWAAVLAEARVSRADAARLIERGCSHEHAIHILL